MPVRDDAYAARCARASAAVARAAGALQAEWAHELLAGKLAAKAGAPIAQVLSHTIQSFQVWDLRQGHMI